MTLQIICLSLGQFARTVSSIQFIQYLHPSNPFEIVLANWPSDKHIICNVNNDIPIKIPNHPYFLVNRSVLCKCRIEADNHHLLESIATCDNKISNLVMYFAINMACTNFLNMLPNLTNSLPLIKDRTKYEWPLPLSLRLPDFDSSLKLAPTSLKYFMHVYANNKEIFDLKQRHVSTVESLIHSNKNFFSNNYIMIGSNLHPIHLG